MFSILLTCSITKPSFSTHVNYLEIELAIFGVHSVARRKLRLLVVCTTLQFSLKIKSSFELGLQKFILMIWFLQIHVGKYLILSAQQFFNTSLSGGGMYFSSYTPTETDRHASFQGKVCTNDVETNENRRYITPAALLWVAFDIGRSYFATVVPWAVKSTGEGNLGFLIRQSRTLKLNLPIIRWLIIGNVRKLWGDRSTPALCSRLFNTG